MMTSGFWRIGLIVAAVTVVIPAASAQHVILDAPGLTGRRRRRRHRRRVLSLQCGHGSTQAPSCAAPRTTSIVTPPT